MKVFIVLSCIALAVARPEAGYSYNQPGAGSLGGGATFSNGATFTGAAPSLSNGFGGSGLLSSNGFNGAAGLSNGGFGRLVSNGGSFGGGSGLSNGGFSAGGFSNAGFSAPQQALIQKHIYVHVPPQGEEELAQPINNIQPAQPQKHYKIIFIKAPSAPTVNRQHLQLLAQPQNEEKTLVYVLSKKQESVSDVIQTIQPAPITPSKPEVYFIKYKTQKEQQGFVPGTPISTGPISAGPISAEPQPGPISSGFDSVAVSAPGATSFSGSSGLSSSSFGDAGNGGFGGLSNGGSFGSGAGLSNGGSFSTATQSGSSELSLPIAAAHQPAPVYGPAH